MIINYRENTFALTIDSHIIHEKHNIVLIVICAVIAIISYDKPPAKNDSNSHLLVQGCCYHCLARSQLLQRGPLLQQPERESDHPAH